MQLITRNIPTQFLVLDTGKEFLLDKIHGTIYDLLDAPFDDLGHYGLKDYELTDKSVADELVRMGLLNKVRGPRQCTLYEVTDKGKLEDFYNQVLELLPE